MKHFKEFDVLELPRKINDMSDDEHIQTMERFLQVCVERILDKNQKTNEKLYTIASSINAITEFIIAESKYSRFVHSDITKLLSNVQITQDLEE
jgi:aspartyl/asparaginyl-tRNA synthetase